MLRLLLRWFLHALALLIVTWLVPGFRVTGLGAALIAALVIGLLNATLGLLLKIITFPLSVITFGIFFLVINAFVLKLASGLVPGFYVRDFTAAFVGAVVLALLHIILGLLDSSD
ncbi:phage holin family protein [Paracidobacterium acidisoli]|uniref:Phage holin family protein n=1 Tax=Paracidobacterium acidisoli TaxID=2303751 RepID=A0A372IP45_9BACT|nr:phage holin family protein [Paracidobacterium acidisoli]MBT9330966.1 phage holin family protein [Paracidobacterium acidisoli]